jgi:hypothetical protein
MAETQSAPTATEAPSNLTRASITGKVPDFARPRHGRGRKGAKRGKLSASGRRHAKQLMKAGAISPKAAAANGLSSGAK